MPFGGDCGRFVLFQMGLPRNIEAGVDTCISSSEGPWLNVKWLVANETLPLPAIAIGVQGMGEGTVAEPYLALSKDMGDVRVHIGGIHTEHHTYGMLGAEAQVGPRLAVCPDHVSGHAGTTSVGLSWEVSDTILATSARIFAVNNDDSWYLNVGYALAWSQ